MNVDTEVVNAVVVVVTGIKVVWVDELVFVVTVGVFVEVFFGVELVFAVEFVAFVVASDFGDVDVASADVTAFVVVVTVVFSVVTEVAAVVVSEGFVSSIWV